MEGLPPAPPPSINPYVVCAATIPVVGRQAGRQAGRPTRERAVESDLALAGRTRGRGRGHARMYRRARGVSQSVGHSARPPVSRPATTIWGTGAVWSARSPLILDHFSFSDSITLLNFGQSPCKHMCPRAHIATKGGLYSAGSNLTFWLQTIELCLKPCWNTKSGTFEHF